jgi:hypothetical protein
MKPPELTTWRISRLHNLLLSRCFAVPKLQRNFVWDAARAAKLMDSVYRDMPIGSIFLWEMDRKSANLIRQSADVLPSFYNGNPKIWFVIDGQQRLSVIHQAFEGEVRQNDAGRNIDFGRLCFLVHPDQEQDFPPRIVYRKPVDGEIVPIHDILSPDWKRRMPSHANWFLAKVAKCRDQLLKYEVPVVVIRSASLEEIGEVFIRVNSQGMRITSADRAIALMGKLDVRAMAQELRQKVRDDVFTIGSIDPILMGFNLVAEKQVADGDPPKLDVMAHRWSRRIERDDKARDDFKKRWNKYQKAFLAAVQYLHVQFPIYDASYLPSANMLATLAVFFFHHPGQPDKYQRDEIRKWFWATGVGKRYSGGGYHRNLVSDAKLFQSLAQGSKRRFAFLDRLDPVLDIQSEEYNSSSARTRAFFCLLAKQGPRYLENGEEIPLGPSVVDQASLKHRHHVFPRAQLTRHFQPRAFNSLCNICFLVSRDNEMIGKKLPRKYLATYQSAGRRYFARVMKSHLIPAGKDGAVWEHGVVRAFKLFRSQRLALICKAFEKEAGIKLFRKG